MAGERYWVSRARSAVLLLFWCGACSRANTSPGAAPPPAANVEPEAAPASAPPPAPKRPVENSYHGVVVSDDYRWLEDSADPKVRAFSEAQNAYTRRILGSIPQRGAIYERVSQVYRQRAPSFPWLEVAGGSWFVMVYEPPAQQPFIVVVPSGSSPVGAAPLVDPNRIDSSGKTAIDWFAPSPDGSLLAVSLSQAGTESGDLSIYDVKTGAKLPDSIARVNGGTAGGDLAWLADSSGFYYTRYPRKGERPAADLDFYQQIYFHRLGTPQTEDRFEIGRNFPRIAENQLDIDRATGRVLLTVQRGDGGEFAHYLRDTDGEWRQFSRFGDKLVEARFIPQGSDLLLISRRRSPLGELLRLDGRTLDASSAEILVPAGEAALVSDFWGDRHLLATDRRIYATYQRGGPYEVRVFDHRGQPQQFAMPVEPASVAGLTRDGASVLMRAQSFVKPGAWYRFDEKRSEGVRTTLADAAPVDLSGYSVAREFAVSKDGTRVPINILIPPGVALDGKSACLATGYGGYGLSLGPHYSVDNGLWLERGVIVAIANLRGGGEYGEAWHVAGNLTNKQNVFDDFEAVLRHLIERGYTKPERLGIIGGSNGGLLMGATMIQHPELVRAVVSYVGMYDMLRTELSPNGEFNITEFGTVQDRAQFEALYAYSPYHHVRDGAPYPATLLLTGENDPRVEPWQSRKMAARLQAAQGSAEPILLRVSFDSGHGGDSSLGEMIEERTDVQSFMMNALRVE